MNSPAENQNALKRVVDKVFFATLSFFSSRVDFSTRFNGFGLISLGFQSLQRMNSPVENQNALKRVINKVTLTQKAVL